MSWQVWIEGNQDDPKHGNPIPWCAMSQRSKYIKPEALRFIAWKAYIQGSWLERFQTYPRFDRRHTHRLDLHIVFRDPKPGTKCTHADSTNVRKGCEDALFGKYTHSDDQHVWGMTSFDHGVAPGLLIDVWGTE